MKLRAFVLLLACLMLFGIGCKKDKQPQGTILAQVGDDKLYEESFKSVFSEEEWASMDSETRKKYVQDWVNLTLLAQESKRAGLDNSLEVKQKLDFATKKVKANALIADRMADLEISEDALLPTTASIKVSLRPKRWNTTCRESIWRIKARRSSCSLSWKAALILTFW